VAQREREAEGAEERNTRRYNQTAKKHLIVSFKARGGSTAARLMSEVLGSDMGLKILTSSAVSMSNEAFTARQEPPLRGA
jgi:hypothetical protein